MKIRIHKIFQEGLRNDNAIPNSNRIYSAHNFIGLSLLKQGYVPIDGIITVKPQGYGHSSPRIFESFSNRKTLIDNIVYFNKERNSAVIEVNFAVKPEELEAVVLEVTESSALPMKWECRDFGEFDVKSDYTQRVRSVEELGIHLKSLIAGDDTAIVMSRDVIVSRN